MKYAYIMRRDNAKSSENAARVRRVRLRLGLTQVALAEKLGVDQSTISRLESGKKPRKDLETCINEFVAEAEVTSAQLADDIVAKISKSKELRALVVRVMSEL